MENINIAEILKNCPKGMELYSPMYGVGKLTKITNKIHVKFPKEHNVKCFRLDGKVSEWGEIMLFPKDKNTWDGFVPPCKFKDGDVISGIINGTRWYGIYKKELNDELYCYVSYSNETQSVYTSNKQAVCQIDSIIVIRFATEEEKAKLFQAIKDNGYHWNNETKTLEKVTQPKFKAWDKVRHKNNHNVVFTITNIEDDYYTCGDKMAFSFDDQDNYEFVPNKFDITTLVPFESKVLVRDDKNEKWYPSYWGFYCKEFCYYQYIVVGGRYRYCIPYEDNEHLLGTTKDCDDFYKTW